MSALPAVTAPPAHVTRSRVGAGTTLHVARYDLSRYAVRVVRLRRATPLEAWCAQAGVSEALVGGFFVRSGGDCIPLGELRTGGVVRESVAFDAPWGALRACLHAADGALTIARRPDLPAQPHGDLLQAGPLLVAGGAVVVGDEEGFSAGQRQFDSDITAGRYPRAALGVTADGVALAVACDGRADDEAGLDMRELAEALVGLGAVAALNLDGGGSTSLVCGGTLVNTPREAHGKTLAGGRPVPTAVTFTPR